MQILSLCLGNMDDSNSQTFANGYFSHSQIIKITRILQVCERYFEPRFIPPTRCYDHILLIHCISARGISYNNIHRGMYNTLQLYVYDIDSAVSCSLT